MFFTRKMTRELAAPGRAREGKRQVDEAAIIAKGDVCCG
jgi:hypothetical protein